MNRKVLLLFGTVGVSLASGFVAQAAEIFVDQDSVGGTCSDSNSGQSANAPVCHISRGLELATLNDTVTVRRGLYMFSSTLYLSKNGMKFRSYPNETPAILDFTNAGPVVGVYLTAPSEMIEGFEIRNAAQECVQGGGGAAGLVIRKNHIHDCGKTYIGGKYQNCIDTDGDGTLIESNLVHDAGSHILYVTGNGITIRNNLIYRSIFSGGRGIQVGTGPYTDGRLVASNVSIVHNVIGESATRSGVVLYASGATINTVKIDNNIFYENAQYPVEIYSDSTFTGANEIRNNIFAGNGSGNTIDNPISAFSISGNIPFTSSSSIQWVNRSSRDFHLLSGSPAINAALPGLASTDFDGNARPAGAASDIGPYEFGAGPSADNSAPAAPAGLRVK